MFFALQSKDVERESWWVRPLLEEFDRLTDSADPDDVLDAAKKAESQLWGYYDGTFRGVVATQIRNSRKGAMLLVWVCYGIDAKGLLASCYAEIENWAREKGCKRVQIVGREGWERVLPGFKRKAVVLEKRL